VSVEWCLCVHVFQNWLWQQAGPTVELPMTDVFPLLSLLLPLFLLEKAVCSSCCAVCPMPHTPNHSLERGKRKVQLAKMGD